MSFTFLSRLGDEELVQSYDLLNSWPLPSLFPCLFTLSGLELLPFHIHIHLYTHPSIARLGKQTKSWQTAQRQSWLDPILGSSAPQFQFEPKLTHRFRSCIFPGSTPVVNMSYLDYNAPPRPSPRRPNEASRQPVSPSYRSMSPRPPPGAAYSTGAPSPSSRPSASLNDRNRQLSYGTPDQSSNYPNRAASPREGSPMLPYSDQSHSNQHAYYAGDPSTIPRSDSAMYSLAESNYSYGSKANLYDTSYNQSAIWNDKDLSDDYGRPHQPGGTGAGAKRRAAARPVKESHTKRKWIIAAVVLAIIAAAVAVPLALKFTKDARSTSNANANAANDLGSSTTNGGATPTSGGAAPTPTANGPATSGGDGSTVTRDDGSTFIYSNKFGGTWVSTCVLPSLVLSLLC